MKKYKVKLERIQEGKKLDWEREVEIETSIPPKVGSGQFLLVDPPILQRIVSIEECNEQKIK